MKSNKQVSFILCLLLAVGAFIALPYSAQTLPSATGNLLKAGGFEDGDASLFWDQESSADSLVIQHVSPDSAHGGQYLARLGRASDSVDTLDQFLGAIPVYYGPLQLSFYCRAQGVKPGRGNHPLLSVQILDSEDGTVFPLGDIELDHSDWTLQSLQISAASIGLIQGRDYYLRFTTSTSRHSKAAPIDIDDVTLAHLVRQELMPNDPPDPPDTVPDEEGDIPTESTAGHHVVVNDPVHRDLPNTCSCGYGSHRTISLTATGFSTLSGVKVKFKTPTGSKLKAATNIVVNGDIITCTIPDSPAGKNYLGAAEIKVKAGTEKAWVQSSDYSVDNNTGTETGFWYGFPDPIRGLQVQSTTTPSILGGDNFQATVTGMSVFTKWRKTLAVCGSRDQDLIRPFIYLYPYAAADPKNSTDLKQKVRVQRNPLTNSCGSNTWSSSWTGDGAPAICNNESPCIRLNDPSAPQTLVLLNPDNIANEGTGDWRQYTWRKGWFAGVFPSAVALTLPPPPAFAPGTNYGPANSVGYGSNGSGPVDIAIRPLNDASNSMKFQGTGLYRIRQIENSDQPGVYWDPTIFNGPTWDTGNDWGGHFNAWAKSHQPASSITPYLATKDMDMLTLNGVPFNYKASFAAVSTSKSCLSNPTSGNCDITIIPSYYGTYDWGDVEFFLVGPEEGTTVTAVPSCYSGACGNFSLLPTVSSISTDSEGRSTMKVHLQYTVSQSAAHNSSASFTLKIRSSGYGTIESRNVVIIYY